jgi:hypothetical protein
MEDVVLKRTRGAKAVDAVKQDETQVTSKEFKRTYNGQQVLDHDLYKLEVSSFQRNASYNDNAPILENVEHSHFFHSIDSRGRPQIHCNKVGGHFHEVAINADGTALCGPPVREVKVKRGGRTITKLERVPAIGYMADGITPAIDNHTHKVTYRGSEKITPPTANMEFAKVQSKFMAEQAKIDAIKIPDMVDNG